MTASSASPSPLRHKSRLFLAGLTLAVGTCFAEGQPDIPLDANAQRMPIDDVLTQLRTRYVFPERAAAVEAALASTATARTLRDLTDPMAFCERLTVELQASARDRHLSVEYSSADVANIVATLPDAKELARRQEEVRRVNYGVAKVENLPGNIGYLDLRHFPDLGLAATTISAAMTLVAPADALIVDLRENSGGSPATVAFAESSV